MAASKTAGWWPCPLRCPARLACRPYDGLRILQVVHYAERIHLWWERVRERFRYHPVFWVFLIVLALAGEYFSGWILSRLTWEVAREGWGLLMGFLAVPIGLAGLLMLLYTALIFAQAYADTRKAPPPTGPAPQPGPDIETFTRFFDEFSVGLQKMIMDLHRKGSSRYFIAADATIEHALNQSFVVIDAYLEPGFAMLDLHPDVREALDGMILNA